MTEGLPITSSFSGLQTCTLTSSFDSNKAPSLQNPLAIQRRPKTGCPPSGRAQKIEPALITSQHFPVAAVVCIKEKGMKEPCCLAASLVGKSLREFIHLYSRRFTIEETFRNGKAPHFGLGLSQVRIADPHRRDRLLFVCALAIAILTLLGAASDAAGLDRLLNANTVKTRTHSLFRQGLYWFSALPNAREKWRRPLLEHFKRIPEQQALCQAIFAVL